MPSPWYLNPAWYALVIAIVGAVLSLVTYRFNLRSHRDKVEDRLRQQAIDLNKATHQYGVKGPYAHMLGISQAQASEFSAKAIILLNHINLLRDIYSCRDVLGDDLVRQYQHWARTLVWPWIQADQHLKDVWALARDSTDFWGSDFIHWLEDSFGVRHVTPRKRSDAPPVT